ncbi:MAG: adenine phosphoribosyltransferase [Gemmatimonadota bacterium]
MADRQAIQRLIRDIPDFPKPGILFRDITPLLAEPQGLRAAVDAMAAPFAGSGVDVVVGIEARGFILGAPVALALSCGFVPIRKAGKLPGQTVRGEYELEYGRAAIEMHRDGVRPGLHVLLVDDVLATGGTMAAACGLVESLGGALVGVSFLVELAGLGGRANLGRYRIESVITYD